MSAAKEKIVVIGAGPKAMALVAKRAVLEQLGQPVPELVVIEKSEVAASWSGNFGFTDGEQSLGTPPEKDVGFPYDSQVWKDAKRGIDLNRAVNEAMVAYSWQSYFIHLHLYGDWIDRGRPHPNHKQFHQYLNWVRERARFDVAIGEVTRISLKKNQWELSYKRAGQQFSETGTGLVVTGPGEPKGRIPVTPAGHPLVVNGQDLWQKMPVLRERLRFGAEIGVVGSGETAASAIVGLLDLLGNSAMIRSINRQGVLYSRGESYHENRLFTNPEPVRALDLSWTQLAESQRHEFLRRTDRSVFSLQAQERINKAENVSPLLGEAEGITVSNNRVYLQLAGTPNRYAFDLIVDATGFDPEWFTRLFDSTTRDIWKETVKGVSRQRQRQKSGKEKPSSILPSRGVVIEADLSVDGFKPKLHLPMQAGLDQGPGFPNLSCLGRLSDAVFSSYVAHNLQKPTASVIDA